MLDSTPLRHDVWINAVVFFIALGSLFFVSKFLGAGTLHAWVESAGVWAPLAFVLAKASTIVIAPLAGSFLYPLGGASFGLWNGIALAALGDSLGSSIAFFISRRFGRPLAEKFLGGESGMLAQVLSMMGTVRGFFITRLILITAHDLLSYAAGLTKLPYIPFILIHVSISLIPTAILTGLGNSLFEGSGVTTGILLTGMMVVGVASSIAFTLYAFLSQPRQETPHE